MAENEKNVAEVETKADKPAKKKAKEPGKVKNAWKGFKSELKKIVWPTWKQVLKGSAVVVVVVAICAAAIGGLDFAFSQGIAAIVNLFN